MMVLKAVSLLHPFIFSQFNFNLCTQMVLLALESLLLLLGLLLVLLQHWYAEAEKERNPYMYMFP